jgi:hypothetical protein
MMCLLLCGFAFDLPLAVLLEMVLAIVLMMVVAPGTVSKAEPGLFCCWPLKLRCGSKLARDPWQVAAQLHHMPPHQYLLQGPLAYS